MPFWIFKANSRSNSDSLVRINKLEKKVNELTEELASTQKKLSDLNQLLVYTINAQKQLGSDMNIIYESVAQVAESLQVADTTEDEKYFKWRWFTTNDDDDLPN